MTTETLNGVRSATFLGCCGGRHALALDSGLLEHLVDRAGEHEGLLGQLVALAVDDGAEAGNRVGDGDVLAGNSREHLGDEVRLREEALDPARPPDDQTVFVG